MNYQGFQIVTTVKDNPNILRSLKPRMVAVYQLEEGQWVALSYNELGFVVECIACNQVEAVDTAIKKATSKLKSYNGLQVKRVNLATIQKESVIYWERPKHGDEYTCELTLRVDGVKSTFTGHGRTLENALEHVCLKIRGIPTNQI